MPDRDPTPILSACPRACLPPVKICVLFPHFRTYAEANGTDELVFKSFQEIWNFFFNGSKTNINSVIYKLGEKMPDRDPTPILSACPRACLPPVKICVLFPHFRTYAEANGTDELVFKSFQEIWNFFFQRIQNKYKLSYLQIRVRFFRQSYM
jgi:hypothetical protein